MPASTRGTATLAVVPVDDPVVPALSLVSLAMSCAQQGQQVVVADLASGAPAANLLDAADAGGPHGECGRRAAGRGGPRA